MINGFVEWLHARRWDSTPAASMAGTLEEFRERLGGEIAYHLRRQNLSFDRAEVGRAVAVWTGVIAALAVALFGGKSWAPWLSVLTGISTIAIASERRFSFRARSGWHCAYRLKLERLYLGSDKADVTLAELRESRIALDAEMSDAFPQGSDPGEAR